MKSWRIATLEDQFGWMYGARFAEIHSKRLVGRWHTVHAGNRFILKRNPHPPPYEQIACYFRASPLADAHLVQFTA
jgi:hypothetical protein